MPAAPIFRLTRRAAADLQCIYRYGRDRWGKAQADRYAHQLRQCFTMLAVRPQAGRARPELHPPDVRGFTQSSHVIFYQPQPYGVLIVRILGSAQDVTRHLGTAGTP